MKITDLICFKILFITKLHTQNKFEYMDETSLEMHLHVYITSLNCQAMLTNAFK